MEVRGLEQKQGDLLEKWMTMAWACLVAVTVEKSEWIPAIFGGKWTLSASRGGPLPAVGKMGMEEEGRDF